MAQYKLKQVPHDIRVISLIFEPNLSRKNMKRLEKNLDRVFKANIAMTLIGKVCLQIRLHPQSAEKDLESFKQVVHTIVQQCGHTQT